MCCLGKLEVPTWVDLVKTGTFKELGPYDPVRLIKDTLGATVVLPPLAYRTGSTCELVRPSIPDYD